MLSSSMQYLQSAHESQVLNVLKNGAQAHAWASHPLLPFCLVSPGFSLVNVQWFSYLR